MSIPNKIRYKPDWRFEVVYSVDWKGLRISIYDKTTTVEEVYMYFISQYDEVFAYHRPLEMCKITIYSVYDEHHSAREFFKFIWPGYNDKCYFKYISSVPMTPPMLVSHHYCDEATINADNGVGGD